MWGFGTQVDPTRPACRCLVALPGVINVSLPQCTAIIDYADWPHWLLWGWVLIGVDVQDEPALETWLQTHPDG